MVGATGLEPACTSYPSLMHRL